MPRTLEKRWLEVAEAEARKSYPMLSATHWWALRRKFRQSLPGVVTDSYLATVLSMAANSARANVLPFMKAFGLIDQDNKTTERAKLWRDNGTYPDVCTAIVSDVYPDELRHAIPDPRSDRVKLESWFANRSGVGKGAAGRMAAIYTVLIEADPAKESEGGRKLQASKTSGQRQSHAAKPHSASGAIASNQGLIRKEDSTDQGPPPKRPPRQTPEVNINLQIHISADASADQIDQIFASMANHLYKNG